MSTPTISPKFALREPRVGEPLPPHAATAAKISVRELSFYYGRAQALHNISLNIPERMVMALIGPSGCGKSTFLRTLNRMNDVIAATRVEGEVTIDGRDIYAAGKEVGDLRRSVGLGFDKSDPFPKSSFSHVCYRVPLHTC